MKRERKSSSEYEKNRSRNIPKIVRFTETEFKKINENLNNSPYTNLNDYIVNACLNVEIKIVEHEDLYSLANEINRIGVNINQIAKHVNETNAIYSTDIKAVKDKIDKVQKLVLDEFKRREEND